MTPLPRWFEAGRIAEIAECGVLDGEALAAAAGALGVGVGEDEAGGEIVLAPVHRAADQIEHEPPST